MKGSVSRYCACGDPLTGKRFGKQCPSWTNSRHGQWLFVVDVPGLSGKRKQIRRGGFRSKAEAEKARDLAVRQIDEGAVFDDRLTTGEWLEYWLAEKSKTAGGSAAGRKVRSSTALAYRSHVDLYLIPHLGAVRLASLRPEHVSRAYDAIVANPHRPRVDSGEMSAATLRRIHATLRSALNAALRAQRIPRNPAQFVELSAVRRPRVHPWEAAELGHFLDHAATHRLGALFEVMALTGLRRGEALGLRWGDVDLARAVVLVRQQLVQVGRRCEFGPPKTASGEHRTVELDDVAIGALIGLRLRQDQERLSWGDTYTDLDLVFAREDGAAMLPDTVSKTFRRLAIKAGLRPIRLHDLRHGQASLMLAAGVPMPIVSKRLGHSTLTITSDTYSHLLEGVGRDAAQRASNLVPRQPRDTHVTPTGQTSPPERPEQPRGPGFIGAPRGTRTHNLRIKSPQL